MAARISEFFLYKESGRFFCISFLNSTRVGFILLDIFFSFFILKFQRFC